MIKSMLKLCAISTALLLAHTPIDAGIMDLMRSAVVKKEGVEPPSIRVLLTHDQSSVILEVKGKYKIFDPRTGDAMGLFQGKRRMLQPMSNGIRWGEEFPEVYQIAIVPDSPETAIIVDSVEYRGTIFVYNVGGSLSIVNKVNIEEYLSSTLASIYRDPLPKELMSAIAIVARTHAYYQAQKSTTPYWDVDASQEGYQGIALSRYFKGVESAIQDTKYMVLNRIGKGEWSVTPFAVAWRPQNGGKLYKDRTYSLITFEAAEQLAKKGENAPEILKKAFPDTTIQLEYSKEHK